MPTTAPSERPRRPASPRSACGSPRPSLTWPRWPPRRLRLAADRRRTCAQRPAQHARGAASHQGHPIRMPWCACRTMARRSSNGCSTSAPDPARAHGGRGRAGARAIAAGHAVPAARRAAWATPWRSLWTARADYMDVADDEICLLVQARTVTAMRNLREICAVDGVLASSSASGPVGLHGPPTTTRPPGCRPPSRRHRHHRRQRQGGGHPHLRPGAGRALPAAGLHLRGRGVDVLLFAHAARRLRARFSGGAPSRTHPAPPTPAITWACAPKRSSPSHADRTGGRSNGWARPTSARVKPRP